MCKVVGNEVLQKKHSFLQCVWVTENIIRAVVLCNYLTRLNNPQVNRKSCKWHPLKVSSKKSTVFLTRLSDQPFCSTQLQPLCHVACAPMYYLALYCLFPKSQIQIYGNVLCSSLSYLTTGPLAYLVFNWFVCFGGRVSSWEKRTWGQCLLLPDRDVS